MLHVNIDLEEGPARLRRLVAVFPASCRPFLAVLTPTDGLFDFGIHSFPPAFVSKAVDGCVAALVPKVMVCCSDHLGLQLLGVANSLRLSHLA